MNFFKQDKAIECGIPDYMLDGLNLYFNHGIEPGSFLTSVLENNLVMAAACADDTNSRLLKNYANFLYNFAPSSSWGSKEKVEAWISMHLKNRQEVADGL